MGFSLLLSPYRDQINIALDSAITSFGEETKLKKAMQYALKLGGKRFRPALVLMIAKAIGKSNFVLDAALAVEYFHTASLIADDLPCMDDDDERRGSSATHIVYGEAVALLASYALIASGYELIANNAQVQNSSQIGILAIENATKNTGVLGATGGQFLDLFPPLFDYPTYEETIIKKTVSLFEISFVLGWLFGGGDVNSLPQVKKAAYHYGMAFQIADDFDDALEDLNNKRLMNAVNLLGFEKSCLMLEEHTNAYFQCLKELHIESEELIGIGTYLQAPKSV